MKMAKEELAKVGSKLCRTFAKFSIQSIASRTKAWKCTPKLHLFIHICEWDTALGNPKFYWTYADEDMVGQMVKAGESCHPRTLAVAGMFKWLSVVFTENAECD